ncbi:MAG: DUF1648 domain-containing protein [Chloroflexi bacterium]|nr:DUF1648 domain-containing protein [Chloroflexota bacterium]
MELRPPRLLGVLTGVGIVLGILLLTGSLLLRLNGVPLSLYSFSLALVVVCLLFLLPLFAYWTYGCWSLRYRVDRNALTIRWIGMEQVVPLSKVVAFVTGSQLRGRMRFRGVNWFGYHVGRGQVVGVGKAVFYATSRRPKELLCLTTADMAYVISVKEPARLVRNIRLRQGLGATKEVAQVATGRTYLPFSLGRQPGALAMVMLALIFNIALFGYVSYVYPSLPQLLPLHFTPFGQVDRVGPKVEVLWLPSMALAAWSANLFFGLYLYAKERLGMYLCLGASLLVQTVIWVAIIRLVVRV